MLPILSGVVAGVLFGRFFTGDILISAGIMAVVGISAIAVRFMISAEVLLSMALGAIAASSALPRQFAVAPENDCMLAGIVTEVSLNAGRQSADVRIDGSDGGRFSARITYPVFTPVLHAGDIISFSGTYSLPRRATDLPLEDDLSEFYLNDGISLLCYVPKGRLRLIGRSGNPLYALKRMRADLVDRLYSSGLDEPTAIFLVAVLTGDTSALTPVRRQEYASAGVAHILALSGAHVAIIAAVVSILLFPLVIAGHRRLRWWITIALLWVYAALTGMSPSVCRAVIMATAVLMALIFDRPRSSLNALCLAAILILLFSPLSLFNTGFQLSFVATLCIILFSPKLMPHTNKKLWRRAWSIVAVTLAATLGTFPLVAWHFHSVPLFFFVANIAAVAVMPLMISGGLLLSLLLMACVESAWLVDALDFIYGIFDGVVGFVAGMPEATLGGIYVSGWLLIPMYLALAFFGAWLYLRRRNYLILSAATLLFTIGVYAATCPRYADGEAYMLRSQPYTSIARHHGDTMTVMTLSPPYEFGYDSLVIADRYRDYVATRGIRHIELIPLDTVATVNGGIVSLGRHSMLVPHIFEGDAGDNYARERCDYCLLTAKWYGDPVALYHSGNADTIVLSTDMNRRRRQRYYRELTAAGIPAIDLGERPLSSNR